MTSYRDQRAYVEQLVFEQLRQTHGPDSIAEQPAVTPSGRTYTRITPSDPLTAAHVACWLRDHANDLLREYARAARGEGRTWSDVADVLRISDSDPERATRAYTQIAGNRISRSVSWRCSTCLRTVIDYGPYAASAADNEKGHASTCTRHEVDISGETLPQD